MQVLCVFQFSFIVCIRKVIVKPAHVNVSFSGKFPIDCNASIAWHLLKMKTKGVESCS